MKEFFLKYGDLFTEKMALKLVHCKLHKIRKEYDENKDYTQDLLKMHNMIGDLLIAKGVLPPSPSVTA